MTNQPHFSCRIYRSEFGCLSTKNATVPTLLKLAMPAVLCLFHLGCGAVVSEQISETPVVKKDDSKKEPEKPAYVPPTLTSVPQAIEVMRTAANEDDQKTRIVAQQYLIDQGSASIEPVGALVMDTGENVRTRMTACRVLGKLGQPAKPKLVAGLQAKEQIVKLNALEQLSVLTPTSEDIVDILIAHLDDDDMRVQRVALSGLAYIGEPAGKAEKRLLTMLNTYSENDTLRGGAKKALKAVNPRTSFRD
jgi:hypothetical protein